MKPERKTPNLYKASNTKFTLNISTYMSCCRFWNYRVGVNTKFTTWRVNAHPVNSKLIQTFNYKGWLPSRWKIFACHMPTLFMWHTPKHGHSDKIWHSVILRSPYMSSSFQLTQKSLTNCSHLCLSTVLADAQLFQSSLDSCCLAG